MARYIDADALKEQLEDFSKWCRDGRKQGVDFVLDCVLPNIATADVAPRSEVAREIFAEMGATAFTMHDDDSGEFILCMYCENFEELKQKYTEE